MRRSLLIAGLAALSWAALPAHASGVSDVGSWGQAWGDDDPRGPAQPSTPSRPRASIPASMPAQVPAPIATQPPQPAAVDTGGWGQAWGNEPAVPAQPSPPSRPRASVSAAMPVQAPSPVALPAPQAAAVDTGSWGQAWGATETTAPTQPARPRAQVAPSMPAGQSARTATAPFANAPRPGDIGGWGAAWDEDPRAPAQPPRPTTAQAVQAPTTGPAAPSSARSAAPRASAPAEAGLPVEMPSSPESDADEPVQMTADQIVHDRELGIVTAKGHVEVSQNGRTLVTDVLSYNLKQDVMSATGNVTLIEPEGDIMYADYFEMTGDMKDGVGRQLRVLLADRSRLAAASGTRVAGERTDFDKAVYTACEPCREDPNRTPLWQAKAQRVTHNQVDQVIEYRDAWIEFAGVPVMYTPYLSHPDPTVKRKTGLLTPTMGLSSSLGTNITTPFFWNIADNQDITFNPRFLFPSDSITSTGTTTDLKNAQDSVLQRVVLAGEHRWQGLSGELKTAASFTQDRQTGNNRGHIDSSGLFNLDRTWRAGYQLQRTSDGTYNSLYGYPINSDRPWLTTRPFLEGFGRRNYALAEAMSFQGLRPQDDDDNSTIVLPHMMFLHTSHPDDRGAYWTWNSDALSYARMEGVSARRVSSTVAWNKPLRSTSGALTDLQVSMRGDMYHADHMDVGQDSEAVGRAIPQVSANWRFPMVRTSATMPQTLEPMLMVAASPNGGNPESIPNEDSLDRELDEVSIFSPMRTTGLDRVEGGLRGGYGLRWSAHPRRLGYITAMVGQGWRQHADSTFEKNSGFEDQLSDYVGRVDISPTGNFSLLNRFRINKDSGEFRRNENTIQVGSRALRGSVSYRRFDTYEQNKLYYPSRQTITYGLSSEFSRYWAFQASASHSLSDDGGPLGWSTKLVYSDECFAFVTNFRHSYIHDRDVLAGYELTFNVVFKTLGDLPFNAF